MDKNKYDISLNLSRTTDQNDKYLEDLISREPTISNKLLLLKYHSINKTYFKELREHYFLTDDNDFKEEFKKIVKHKLRLKTIMNKNEHYMVLDSFNKILEEKNGITNLCNKYIMSYNQAIIILNDYVQKSATEEEKRQYINTRKKIRIVKDEEAKESFEKLINYETGTLDNLRVLELKAKNYYEKYATEEEKQKYINFRERFYKKNLTKIEYTKKEENLKLISIIDDFILSKNFEFIENLKLSDINYLIYNTRGILLKKSETIDKETRHKMDEELKSKLIQKRQILTSNSKKEAYKPEKDYKSHILKYINEGYTNEEDYAINNNLQYNDFKKMINFLRETDENLYNAFQMYKKGLLSQRFAVIINKVEKLNEICKEDTLNILEYFKYIKIDPEKLIQIIKKNLKQQDYRPLIQFLNKNSYLKKYGSATLNTRIQLEDEVECKKDNKGNPIKGTGRIITKEEKEEVVSILKQNKIPLYIKVYEVALKKYIKNELNIEEPKSLKK